MVLPYRLYVAGQFGGGVTVCQFRLMMLGEVACAVRPVGAPAGRSVQLLGIPRISTPLDLG